MYIYCTRFRRAAVCVPKQPEQHYKTRRQRAPTAGTLCIHTIYIYIYTRNMAAFIKYYVIFFSNEITRSPVNRRPPPPPPRTQRFYRPFAVGLAIFPDRHRVHTPAVNIVFIRVHAKMRYQIANSFSPPNRSATVTGVEISKFFAI